MSAPASILWARVLSYATLTANFSGNSRLSLRTTPGILVAAAEHNKDHGQRRDRRQSPQSNRTFLGGKRETMPTTGNSTLALVISKPNWRSRSYLHSLLPSSIQLCTAGRSTCPSRDSTRCNPRRSGSADRAGTPAQYAFQPKAISVVWISWLYLRLTVVM